MRFFVFLASMLFLVQETPKPPQTYAIHIESLHYPPLARQAAIQGKVSVAAVVDRQGNVISAEAINGHLLLREYSAANLRTWKFQPNSDTDSRIEVTYQFTLEDSAPSLGEAVSYDLPNKVRIRAAPPEPIIDLVKVKKRHW